MLNDDAMVENDEFQGLLSRAKLHKALQLERVTSRWVREEDCPAIIEIMNESVHDCRRSQTTVPLHVDDMRHHLGLFRRRRWPALVLDVDGEVVAFMSARSLRWGDAASRKAAEIAILVKRSWHGTGAAFLACDHLFARARLSGFEAATCWIVNGNTSSIALAKAYGLELWGRLPRAIGHTGTTSDLLIYGTSLLDEKWLTKVIEMRERHQRRFAMLKARATRTTEPDRPLAPQS